VRPAALPSSIAPRVPSPPTGQPPAIDLSAHFADRLAAVEDLVDPAFVRDDWAERNAALRDALLPAPGPDFLRAPEIRFQMFVDEQYVPHELPYVLDRLPSPDMLREDPFGGPPMVAIPGHGGLQSSSNTVHHLHHLLRYEQETGRRVADAATIVEWGAGYGNLAKLILRLHGGAPTVVLFDTPVFSAVQWLYLTAVLGSDRVVLHTDPRTPPAAGRVNVVPIGLARDLELDVPDLFVSTWALNESAPAAQRLVQDRGWLGARSLLLAMHRGDPLDPVAVAAGARPVPLGDFMPGQHYFVR
jgi:hypothetical protein